MYNSLVLIDYTPQGERRFQRYLSGTLTEKAVFEHTEDGDPEEFADLLEQFRVGGLSPEQIES